MYAIFMPISLSALTSVKSVKNLLMVDDLVKSLQKERGMTATYLSSNGSNLDALQQLKEIWYNTNKLVQVVSYYFHVLYASDNIYPDMLSQTLVSEVNHYSSSKVKTFQESTWHDQSDTNFYVFLCSDLHIF